MSSQKIVKVGVLEYGCVGTAPLLEYLLDECADREDITVRVVSSGAKLTPEEVEAAKLAMEAHEIEKYGDYLLRIPHAKNGSLLLKLKLAEKLEKKVEGCRQCLHLHL